MDDVDWWIDGGYPSRGEPLWMAQPLLDAGMTPGPREATVVDDAGDVFDLRDPLDLADVRRVLLDRFHQLRRSRSSAT